ncbi:amino acid ABC transporter permease [Cohnella nanjingensis]|uniref:Amino acid ABC transporter permease n=1 Tax=Cohnella nanjingensis TaxID=1387779 RepID=A0A7X0VIP1_9BACL|nr:amino acid ABC transporter permease [Cohnella nanjingensis]MBB6675146.1 amino acid ABC transporter permease [Cohnella nanjingensis]
MGMPFDISYVFDYFVKLLPYIRITLTIVGCSLLIGLGIGLLVALPRMYRIPVLQRFSQVYVSFFRGTPILIQLFLFYYGMPEMLKLIHIDVTKVPALYFVIFAYALHTGAFLSEAIRGAVGAVDRGQVEAAYAVGMTGYQAFGRIVLPQALGIAIPVFANLVIAVLKDTSLAFSLGIMELTGKSQTLPTMSQHFVEAYLSLALIYFLISFALEKAFFVLERRLLRYEGGHDKASRAPSGRKWLNRRFSAGLELRKEGARP